jgi:RNA polymerase sigma factor (TIGR02999 family)
MTELTRLIQNLQDGDRQAAAKLLPIVYDELRKLARNKLTSERADQSLNATALVHEAYLRLIGDQAFEGKGHFFAAAAEAMRRILVDAARRKQTLKRGGQPKRVETDPDQLPAPIIDSDAWLDLDTAMSNLAEIDGPAAELAQLRIFGGRSVEEAGHILAISRATAFRHWTYARAWLSAAMAESSKKS